MEFQSCQSLFISLGYECLTRAYFFESYIKIFKTGTCLKILHSICGRQRYPVTGRGLQINPHYSFPFRTLA